MKGIKLFGAISLISVVALNLGACGKSNNTQSSNTDVKNFKSAVPTKTAKKGGVVKVAIETDTPFSGIFNHKYRIDKFHEWQKYMDDEAYVVPISNSYRITAVNKNITGYSLQPSDSSGNSFPNWYKVAYVK